MRSEPTVTDLTLCCLDVFCTAENAGRIDELHNLLCALRPDWLELTPAALRCVKQRAPFMRYSLRVANRHEAALYPGFDRYMLESGNHDCQNDVRFAAHVRCSSIADALALFPLGGERVVGLPRFLCEQDHEVLAQSDVCLCPENDAYLATANAIAFLELGGRHVAASFGGLHNFACLEEILLALHIANQRNEADYTALPALRDTLETLTNRRFSPNKPVLGRHIFHVESGVHVDGLMKDSRLYEPFPPETVGQERHVIIGKHSGQTSIRVMLAQEGYREEEFDIDALLSAVKRKSHQLGRGLSREEFRALAHAQFLSRARVCQKEDAL